jgi:hypothetical protein
MMRNPHEGSHGEQPAGENDCLSWRPPLHFRYVSLLSKDEEKPILTAEGPIVTWRSEDCKVAEVTRLV